MINEELISAYLDGELTAEEQIQVEQALASDPRLRRMHDDLRALRSSLQAIPPQKLDSQFAERVLRAAERAKAEQANTQHEPAVHHEPEVIVKSHHGSHTTVAPAQHEPLAWRVVVWTVAALAAAIMCVLFLPDRTAEVVHNTGRNNDAVVTETAPNLDRNRSAPSAPKDSELANSSAFKEMKEEELAKKQSDSKQETQAGRVGALRDAVGNRDAAIKDEVKGRVEEKSAAQRSFDGPPTAAGGKSAEGLPEGAKISRGLVREELRMEGRTRQLFKAAAAEEEELVVVQLELSPEQWKDRDIDAALARHGIQVDQADARQSLAELQFRAKKAAGAGAGGGASLDRGNEESDREAGQAEKETRKKVEQIAALSDGADLLYVEATVGEVEAALDELSQTSGDGISVISLDEAAVRMRSADDKAGGSARRNAIGSPKPANALALPEEQGVERFGEGRGGVESLETSKAVREGEGGQEKLDGIRSFAKRIAPPGLLAQDASPPPPRASSADALESSDPPAPGAPKADKQKNGATDDKEHERASSVDKGEDTERHARDRKTGQPDQRRVRVLIMVRQKSE